MRSEALPLMVLQARRKLLLAMLALWALPEDYLEQYLSLRKPRLEEGTADVAIGRAALPRTHAQVAGDARSTAGQPQTPAQVRGRLFWFGAVHDLLCGNLVDSLGKEVVWQPSLCPA